MSKENLQHHLQVQHLRFPQNCGLEVHCYETRPQGETNLPAKQFLINMLSLLRPTS